MALVVSLTQSTQRHAESTRKINPGSATVQPWGLGQMDNDIGRVARTNIRIYVCIYIIVGLGAYKLLWV